MCQHPCLLMDVHEAPISTPSLHRTWPKEEKKRETVQRADLGRALPATINTKRVLAVGGARELAAREARPFFSVFAAR